jgi:hypothetical protein
VVQQMQTLADAGSVQHLHEGDEQQLLAALIPHSMVMAEAAKQWLQAHSTQLGAAGYPIDSTLELLLVLLKGEMPTTLVSGPSSSSSVGQPSPHNKRDDAGTTGSDTQEEDEEQVFVDFEQLQLTGMALCRMAVPCICNNPACTNSTGPTELSLVSGRSCVCGGCRVAHYCSRACQSQHWKQHKPMCKALAAAAAAAEPAAVS